MPNLKIGDANIECEKTESWVSKFTTITTQNDKVGKGR